jgi:hypothetical protein
MYIFIEIVTANESRNYYCAVTILIFRVHFQNNELTYINATKNLIYTNFHYHLVTVARNLTMITS